MTQSRFSTTTSRFISEMIQDRAIVTMKRQLELVYDLLRGAISNDLERHLTQISRYANI